MKLLPAALGSLLFLTAHPAVAWEPGVADTPDAYGSGIHLELPLVDLPFNAVFGLTAPSMQQSLWITTDLYNVLHYGLGRFVDPYHRKWYWRMLGIGIIGSFDGLLVGFPFFSGGSTRSGIARSCRTAW